MGRREKIERKSGGQNNVSERDSRVQKFFIDQHVLVCEVKM